MKTSKGNEKLGKCIVVSRPVGDSCPSSCPFLNNGCYAEMTEKRFPQSRAAGFDNMIVKRHDVLATIEKAIDKNLSIRMHERGDFLKPNGQLDLRYVNNWVESLKKIKRGDRPNIWAYTHIYDKRLLTLAKVGVYLYASVHTDADVKTAKRAGFKLFAYCTKIRKVKGGSTDSPKFVDLPILGRTLVCPEQRLGRKRVTCAGTDETTACNWCTMGKGNVAFLEH